MGELQFTLKLLQKLHSVLLSANFCLKARRNTALDIENKHLYKIIKIRCKGNNLGLTQFLTPMVHSIHFRREAFQNLTTI